MCLSDEAAYRTCSKRCIRRKWVLLQHGCQCQWRLNHQAYFTFIPGSTDSLSLLGFFSLAWQTALTLINCKMWFLGETQNWISHSQEADNVYVGFVYAVGNEINFTICICVYLKALRNEGSRMLWICHMWVVREIHHQGPEGCSRYCIYVAMRCFLQYFWICCFCPNVEWDIAMWGLDPLCILLHGWSLRSKYHLSNFECGHHCIHHETTLWTWSW